MIIVDDEESIRSGLPYIINWQEIGYEIVATGENGNVGLDLIRQYNPDVVIADIRMPGKTGLEMVKEALNEGLQFYPIILSGYSDFSYAKEAIRLGAVSYILKPVDEEELVEVLESIRLTLISSTQKSLKTSLMDKVFGDDSSGLSDFRYIKMLSLDEDVEIESLYHKMSQKNIMIIPMIHRHNLIVFLLSNEEQQERVIEEEWTNVYPHQSFISSRWLDAESSLQALYVEVQDLRKLKFLLPNQLISVQAIQTLKQKTTHTENMLNVILEALFKSGDLTSKLAIYADNFRYNLSLEEDIKWQVNANINWLVEQIKEKVSVSVEWDTQLFHEKLYLTQTFPELMKLVKEYLQNLSDYLAEVLNNLDIIDIIIKYTN